MDPSADWLRLAELLDEDNALTAAVEAAIHDGADPWEGLLDGLDEAGALAYLRADDTGAELVDALVQLPRVFAAQADLDGAADLDDLGAATRAADVALSQYGLRLARLIEADDSWALVVLPAVSVGEVVATAAAVGRSVEAPPD